MFVLGRVGFQTGCFAATDRGLFTAYWKKVRDSVTRWQLRYFVIANGAGYASYGNDGEGLLTLWWLQEPETQEEAGFQMTRRPWLSRTLALIAALFLSSCGDADGPQSLTLLFWQAPSIANPYLSGGNKDSEAAALVLEPLANYDEDGQLVPRLAASIPTVENGGVSEDRTVVTWKMESGVLWSDGTPLTAGDFVFTYGYYCALPDGNCENEPIENVEAVDDLTIRVTFCTPQPYPYQAFVGAAGVVLQERQFGACLGQEARQCETENLYPIGTGPYKISDFRVDPTAGTSEVVYEINENFRIPNQPFFSEVIFKGGGSAFDAARAVLETGEADYAWNLQVEPDVLQSLQAAGKGMLVAAFASNVERLVVNFTDPDPGLDSGLEPSEWSADAHNPHPFLTDPDVRRALSLAIDRGRIAEQLYGTAGEPTCNLVTAPSQFVSPHNDDCLEQDIAGANALLDNAGWLRGFDGIRQKEGVRFRILYQTSTNSVRQTTQELIQEWWDEIGADTELKDIDASEFFGGDPDLDTVGGFLADIQMYTNGPGVDPQSHLGNWRTSEIARRGNDWGSGNVPRWASAEYDAIYEELEGAFVGQRGGRPDNPTERSVGTELCPDSPD